MQLEKISLPDTHSFSPFFLDYIAGKDTLKQFYNQAPVLENFESQINQKKNFPGHNRAVLEQTLTKQYAGLTTSEAVRKNIDSLKGENTFTITTGHQLNIFTGPLYFIFKIVTVINTCKALALKYPHQRFVPVYWMASEDHDFEEISYFRLHGKKYTWSTQQSGAVGRFDPRELSSLLKEIPGDITTFSDAYLKHKTLADAVRYYVNVLFGDEGVIVVDADDRELKKLFVPVMKADLFEHVPHTLVENNTDALKALGYHTQVNAREINFFYLDKNSRDRLESDGENFLIVDRDVKKTRAEIEYLLENEPERFSPNVILRPLYQEVILPNLAYIGGPSEIVYWLQLKQMFEHFAIPFPVLMPRNFGMVMDHTVVRKFAKTGLELKDLFEEKNYLFNHWILKNSTAELTLGKDINAVRSLFAKIKEQAASIDPTLTPHVEAKGKQTLHQLEIIEKKMLRAEKRRHAEKLSQVEAIKDSLFPGGGLQERTDNFLNFSQQKASFIKDTIGAFDPFDYRMHILQYHD